MRRFHPALLAGLFFLLGSFLTRVVFALRPESAELSGGELLQSFAVGMGFDLVAAVYWITPYVLWLALLRGRVARSPFGRALNLGFFLGAWLTYRQTSDRETLFRQRQHQRMHLRYQIFSIHEAGLTSANLHSLLPRCYKR